MAALDVILTWVLGNADPANLVALGIVYWRLRRDHRSVMDALEVLVEEHDDLTVENVLDRHA